MTARPTDRALAAWWTAQPDGPYSCTDCGHQDSKAYVQPQHPAYAGGVSGTALCPVCIDSRNRRSREERRAQLAALPRCEVPRCGRRAAYRHNGTGICGAHLKRARAELARRTAPAGWLAIFGGPMLLERAQLVELATTATPTTHHSTGATP